jgi:hypothetical protein
MWLGGHEKGEVSRRHTPPQPLGTNELGMLPKPALIRNASHYFLYKVGTSRLRPLRRRFCSTRRPPRVDIRARKPCVRARRVLCGWYVRFIAAEVGSKHWSPGRSSRAFSAQLAGAPHGTALPPHRPQGYATT